MQEKALESLLKDLRRLRIKAEIKKAKEEEKSKNKFIKFKGNICCTHEDIDDVYRYDGCSSSECDKAHNRLDKLLKTDDNGQTSTDIYLKILNKFIGNLAEELEEVKFEKLPFEERKKILEERLKE